MLNMGPEYGFFIKVEAANPEIARRLSDQIKKLAEVEAVEVLTAFSGFNK